MCNVQEKRNMEICNLGGNIYSGLPDQLAREDYE